MSQRSSPRTRHFAMPAVLAVAALAAGLAAMPAPAHALDLTVEVTGSRSDRGFVSAALYSEATGWLKQTIRAERVAAGPRAVIVFRDLPAGTYALAVMHDENGNGQLDRNVVGVPTEPYGFSRDARGVFGPPKWEDAVLMLDASVALQLKMQ